MARRPGAGGDRHALLSSTALPTSSLHPRGGAGGPSSSSPSPRLGAGVGGVANGASYRTASPFEQPYGAPDGINTSDPYAEYGIGAPKKEPPQPYGTGYGYGGSSTANGGLGTGSGPGGGLYGNDKTTGQKLTSLFGMQTADQLEEANDERLEGLTARVRLLKDITVGIGNEVRDSTKDLDSLGEAFSNTSAFLGNTFKRMNHMARRQGGWFCNMMMFLLVVIWIFVSVDNHKERERACCAPLTTCAHATFHTSLCLALH